MAYLRKGNLLWVNRVSAPDATKALASFILPSNYNQFAGNWVLTAQSTTDITLELSDYISATGSNKVIKLDASTVVPGFNPTDNTQLVVANGLLGSDFNSFVSYKTNAVGNFTTITLGAGKGITTTIKDVIAGVSGPAIKLPLGSFPTSNSPTTAFAAGSISIAQPSSWSAPTQSSPLMVLGISNDAIPVKLTYFTTGYGTDNLKAGLLVSLTSAVEATKLTALETLVTAVAATAYEIGFPLYNPSVAGNNVKNLTLLKAILDAMMFVMAKTSAPSETNLAVAYAHLRALVATGLYGVGSIDSVTGASNGFKAVTSSLDSIGNIISLRLDSMVAGVLGTFKYSLQTPAPVVPFIVQDQVVSGSFATGMYRPVWDMIPAGTSSFVPRIVKLSSIGESDASNLTAVMSFDITNVTSDHTQNYSLKLFERLASVSVSPTSLKVGDFSLVEQYDGTLEGIQSNVSASSRRIAMKIDYSTTDMIDMTTGAVTLSSVLSDQLVFSPVLQGSRTDNTVAEGYVYASNISGYDRLFNVALVGGTAGSPITKDDILGDESANTGIYAFSNPEMIDINVLLAPGWSADPSVAMGMVSLCEDRGDAMAIIDTPFGLTVQNVASYRQTISNINSSYAAMYYPWVKITDSVNKKDIFIPPSGPVVGQYAYTDQVADVYYAPAGRTRGTLADVISTERVLNQGDRDMLALNQINPIHNEAGYGIYIKGQYTLQSTTTALDRVNVRRLLLKLRKVIATASKVFEFEPGDTITAYKLKQVATTILEDHLKKGALVSYTVDVGPNVNTLLVRENNELRMEISIIPTKTAERIYEVFTILPQGGGVSIA